MERLGNNPSDSTMRPQNLMDPSLLSVSSHHPPKSFYRPDVDGLRALAVLPVILFHAGFSCPGGFSLVRCHYPRRSSLFVSPGHDSEDWTKTGAQRINPKNARKRSIT